MFMNLLKILSLFILIAFFTDLSGQGYPMTVGDKATYTLEAIEAHFQVDSEHQISEFIKKSIRMMMKRKRNLHH